MSVYIQTTGGGALFPTPPAGRSTPAIFVTVDAPSKLTTVINGDSWLQRIDSTPLPGPTPSPAGGFGAAPFGTAPFGE